MLKKVIGNTTVCKGTYEEIKDYFHSIQDTNLVIDYWYVSTDKNGVVKDTENHICPIGDEFNFDAVLASDDVTNKDKSIHVLISRDCDTGICCFAMIDIDYSLIPYKCCLQATSMCLLKACLS